MEYLIAYFRITERGQYPSRSFLDGPARPDEIITRDWILRWEHLIREDWNMHTTDPRDEIKAVRVFNFQPL